MNEQPDTWIPLSDAVSGAITRFAKAFANPDYYDPIVPEELKQAEAGPQ